MVKIYGLSELELSRISEFVEDSVKEERTNLYEATLYENVQIAYSFGEVTLSDEISICKLEQLDFSEIQIE